jgi:acetylglutamate synthase
MVWLCWLAKFDSERFTWEQIVEYNQNVSNLLPKVLGLHTVIASMDYEVYDKLNPLIQRIFQVDSLIGSASVLFESGIPESIAPLAKEYEKAIALENDLSRQVANIIQSYAVVTKTLVPSELG